MKLLRFDTSADFLELAESFLERNESLNALPLGLALRTRAGTRSGDVGTRFFVIEQDGEIEGTVLQTPGHAVVFTDMSPEAATFAAKKVTAELENLIGCLGPVDVVDRVAQLWHEAGLGTLRIEMSMGLFELTELVAPSPVPGRMRLALETDFELCQEWMYRFGIDCHLPSAAPGHRPERLPLLEAGQLYLWEVDGEPVACAAWQRPIRTGATISFVYTPDELRGRGYASNLVAALTAALLDGSLYRPARQRINLFADLANPTSTSIYKKLGYRVIGDQRHYMFE